MVKGTEVIFEEWLLDVSLRTPCFVPYEDGEIIEGFSVIQQKSPGKLVGVIHVEGQEAVETWVEENPNWRERFS